MQPADTTAETSVEWVDSHPADGLETHHPADSLANTEAGRGSTNPPLTGPDPNLSATKNSVSAAVEQLERRKSKRQEVEELKEELKKSRWNVFLYLGLGAILFGFALAPLPAPAFWSEDDAFHSDPYSNLATLEKDLGYIWGMPYTDIEIVVSVEVMDDTGGNIEVYMVERDCSDFNIVYEQDDLKQSGSERFALIEDAAPGSINEVTLTLAPGSYCLIVEYASNQSHGDSLDVSAKIYSNRYIGGALGILCWGWATFGFIGAQKHGRRLKEITKPGAKKTPEQEVIEAARKDRISAGPGAGPSAGPGTGPSPPPSAGPPAGPVAPQTVPQSGPPTSPPVGESVPPSGPPATMPDSTPEPEPMPEPMPEPTPEPEPAPEPEPEPEPEPAESAANYVSTGDGYFYIQNEDGSFQPEAYYQAEDGSYIQYQ